MYLKFRRLYISKSKDPPNVAATAKNFAKSRDLQVGVEELPDLESWPAKITGDRYNIATLPKLVTTNYDLEDR